MWILKRSFVTMFLSFGWMAAWGQTPDCTGILISTDAVTVAKVNQTLKSTAQQSANMANLDGVNLQSNGRTAAANLAQIAYQLADAFSDMNLTDGAIAKGLKDGLVEACGLLLKDVRIEAVKAGALAAALLKDGVVVTAAGEVAQKKASFVSSGEGIGFGDLIKLRVDAPIFMPTPHSKGCVSLSHTATSAQSPCVAPANSVLKVDTRRNDAGKVRVRLKKLPKPYRAKDQEKDPNYVENVNKLLVLNEDAKGMVTAGPEYEVSLEELSGYGLHQIGFIYGALVVPYKFYTSDKSFSGISTVGGFLGYNLAFGAVELAPVVSAGVSSVSVVTSDANGAAKTDNKAATSAAWGVVATFNKTGRFQVGLLSGWDWAGEGSGYKYNGKPWIAISFGVDLTK